MDLGIENDAHEAVRTVYFEYLADQFKNDQAERRHRAQRFDNDDPAEKDIAAIKAAREMYVQTVTNRGTDQQATDAARDALNGHHDREQLMKRHVDPTQYQKDPEYHLRMNDFLGQKVEELRRERHQRVAREAWEKSLSGKSSSQDKSKPDIDLGR
jgi:hypothetical protein